ncbi:TPA: TonB-dependent hemoglobin/transferrin/lactoferrin family receptor, partial [Haemophilus influenzae]
VTNGKITRRDGSELQFEKKDKNIDNKIYDFDRFIDTDNQVIEGKLALKRASETWYDCSIFVCDGKIKAFRSEPYWYSKTGKWEEFELEKKDLNGKTFAKIKNNSNGIYSIFPSSPGYLER